MFGIQETVSHTEKQLKTIESYMDGHGYFDPYDCPSLFAGVKRSVQREIMEMMRHASLKEILDSTQLSTGTLGAMGAQYLVPSYVSMKLYQAMSSSDIAPLVSADVPMNQSGEKVYINALARSLAGRGTLGSGGQQFTNAELKLEHYTAPITITNDMMEDNSYDLMQGCITGAGISMAKQSNDKICAVLKRTTNTTGWGTKTEEASGNSTTAPSHVGLCACEVACGASDIGLFRPNILVCPPEVWYDAVSVTAGHPDIAPPRSAGYWAWYGGMDVVLVNTTQFGTITSNKLDLAVSIIMEKEVGVITARNNWLRIENYSDPVKDLAGAVVSGRQGVGELVDAAIGVLTET